MLTPHESTSGKVVQSGIFACECSWCPIEIKESSEIVFGYNRVIFIIIQIKNSKVYIQPMKYMIFLGKKQINSVRELGIGTHPVGWVERIRPERLPIKEN